MRSGKEREHNLQAGDNVEVCEGELINLQGKILSVDGNKITIMPKHEDLKVRTHTRTRTRTSVTSAEAPQTRQSCSSASRKQFSICLLF